MKYKNIIIFCLIILVFHLSVDFIMDYVFDDKAPFWKISIISLLSSIGVFYPYLKTADKFKASEISRFQKRKIKTTNTSLDSLKEVLTNNKIYHIISLGKYHFFSSKIHWKDLGKTYIFKKTSYGFSLRVYPKLSFAVIDKGETFLEVNEILNSIEK